MAVPTVIFLIKFASNLASHADVLRGPSRVPAQRTVRGVGTRDEPLRTSEWEAISNPLSTVQKFKRQAVPDLSAKNVVTFSADTFENLTHAV